MCSSNAVTESGELYKAIRKKDIKINGKRIAIQGVTLYHDRAAIGSALRTRHYDEDLEQIYGIYKKYYAEHPFVCVSDKPVYMKQVVNTNYCFLSLQKEGRKLLITSVVDNLLKGASGQAVQNMNLMFGLDEMEGLRLKASYF